MLALVLVILSIDKLIDVCYQSVFYKYLFLRVYSIMDKQTNKQTNKQNKNGMYGVVCGNVFIVSSDVRRVRG